MHKLRIILIPFVFVFCLVGGYVFAPDLLHVSEPFGANSSAEASALLENILIVHVDDLSKATPELISVWGIFINQTSGSFIIFKPLHPSTTDTAMSQDIFNSFGLTTDKQLTDEFMKTLDNHEVNWTNYVIMDDAAASKVIKWTMDADISQPEIPHDDNSMITHFCSTLSKSDRTTGVEPAWLELASQHLHSNGDITVLAANWKSTVLESPTPLNCKVVP